MPHPKFFNIQKDVKDEGFKHIDYLIKALPKYYISFFIIFYRTKNSLFPIFLIIRIKNRKRALTVIFAQQVAGGVLQGLNVNEREAAASKVEVELNDIRPGTVKHVVYRGDPIFVFHRTPDEISEAEAHDGDEMRDPQKDAERVKDKRWLVVVGVCTHLGCVPTVKAGTYKGFFCTCHGSHFDLSGRIRAGPAARNLLVPKYRFKDEHTLLLG